MNLEGCIVSSRRSWMRNVQIGSKRPTKGWPMRLASWFGGANSMHWRWIAQKWWRKTMRKWLLSIQYRAICSRCTRLSPTLTCSYRLCHLTMAKIVLRTMVTVLMGILVAATAIRLTAFWRPLLKLWPQRSLKDLRLALKVPSIEITC